MPPNFNIYFKFNLFFVTNIPCKAKLPMHYSITAVFIVVRKCLHTTDFIFSHSLNYEIL